MADSVVLLSGGVDSAVALAMQREIDAPLALTFHYGQRHHREIEAAAAVADYYDVPNTVINVDPVLFGHAALINHTGGELPARPAAEPDATYVPARNTVLLAMAAAFAESIGARRVVLGANADDAAGYPDCRPAYIEAFRDVLNQGTLSHVWVHAPLLYWPKKRIMGWANDNGVPLHLTWSCYYGGSEPCGKCGACVLREEASK